MVQSTAGVHVFFWQLICAAMQASCLGLDVSLICRWQQALSCQLHACSAICSPLHFSQHVLLLQATGCLVDLCLAAAKQTCPASAGQPLAVQGIAKRLRHAPSAGWYEATGHQIMPTHSSLRQQLVSNASVPAGKHLPLKAADAEQKQQQPAQQDSPEPGMGGLSSHLAAFTLDLNKFARHSKLKVSAG